MDLSNETQAPSKELSNGPNNNANNMEIEAWIEVDAQMVAKNSPTNTRLASSVNPFFTSGPSGPAVATPLPILRAATAPVPL